jgi:hypothetical protein
MAQAAIERMDGLLARWEPAGDGRCAFLACYTVMTRSMGRELEADTFHDPVWVSDLLDRFADAYFDAVDAYDHDGTPPVPWRMAFDAARGADLTVLQHLLLGINAHINFDLVVVLSELLRPTWAGLTEVDRDGRQRDYDEVNRVIARTVGAVQDDVVEEIAPSLRAVDAVLGPIDEWMATRVLRRWRDRVWSDAVTNAALDDASRPEHLCRVEARATERAERILLGGRVAGRP